MAASVPYQCGCAACRSRQPHPDQLLHRQINLLISRLDEQQRRWFAAVEATRQGHGGVQRLAEITGLDESGILAFARLYGATKRSFLSLGELFWFLRLYRFFNGLNNSFNFFLVQLLITYQGQKNRCPKPKGLRSRKLHP